MKLMPYQKQLLNSCSKYQAVRPAVGCGKSFAAAETFLAMAMKEQKPITVRHFTPNGFIDFTVSPLDSIPDILRKFTN